ncbi:hypothetical protein F5050DRAFT_1546944, partial [Lentinula boryana]
MRLKTYLSFGPTWTRVADALFANTVPKSEKNVDRSVRINIFLQSWQTYQNQNQIPRLKMLIDTAKRCNLRIEGIAFSREILRSMPIWYHKEADSLIRTMNSTAASICLRTNHGIKTVGEAVDLAAKYQQIDHHLDNACKCDGCKDIRVKFQCNHPNGCMNQARKLLDTLPPKWDPRSELPEDYQEEYIPNEEERRNKIIPFDRRVTTTGTLAEIFRVFTDPDTQPVNTLPNLKSPEEHPEQSIHVGTDGSCENNGEENAQAGAGIYIAEQHPQNKSIKLPKYLNQSNQTGELVAAKIAADIIDP